MAAGEGINGAEPVNIVLATKLHKVIFGFHSELLDFRNVTSQKVVARHFGSTSAVISSEARNLRGTCRKQHTR
jgi:hypothetical protein